MKIIMSGILSALSKILSLLARPFKKEEPMAWSASSNKKVERILREARKSIKKKKRASSRQDKRSSRSKSKA